MNMAQSIFKLWPQSAWSCRLMSIDIFSIIMHQCILHTFTWVGQVKSYNNLIIRINIEQNVYECLQQYYIISCYFWNVIVNIKICKHALYYNGISLEWPLQIYGQKSGLSRQVALYQRFKLVSHNNSCLSSMKHLMTISLYMNAKLIRYLLLSTVFCT